MLVLPRIEDIPQIGPPVPKRGAQEKNGLHDTLGACMHLFGGTRRVGSDFMDLDSVRQRKLTRMKSAGPASNDSLAPQTPRQIAAHKQAEKQRLMEKLAPISSSESNVVPSSSTALSHSRAGQWFDQRASEEGRICIKLLSAAQTPRRVTQQEPKDEYSDGEKFVLKRCREMLVRRYGSLPSAFKRLDSNNSSCLTLAEFSEAMSGVMKQSEVRILHRMLDRSGDSVISLDEFLNVLDEQ